MRPGVRLGIDVGSVRIGVAACDPSATLVSPVEVVARDVRGGRDLVAIGEIVAERHAIEVIVGLPTSLSGRPGKAALIAEDFARKLAAAIAPVGVRLVDERMSTVEATRQLREAGRGVRESRGVVDAAAAIVILETALAIERSSGALPGQAVAGMGVSSP